MYGGIPCLELSRVVFSSENLYDGVVAFPGEQYYLVSQDHVVLSVIRQNWEQLGFHFLFIYSEEL